MIGLPFALAVAAILVYAVMKLERTLSGPREADESDESGHGEPGALIVAIVTFGVFLSAILGMSILSHRVDRLEHSPEACARQLGIAYTVADGATEQLDAFERCVR